MHLCVHSDFKSKNFGPIPVKYVRRGEGLFFLIYLSMDEKKQQLCNVLVDKIKSSEFQMTQPILNRLDLICSSIKYELA